MRSATCGRLVVLFLLPGPLLPFPTAAVLAAVDDSLPKLSAEEEADLARGEVVLSIVQYGPEDRRAQSIGYVDANPAELFEILHDPKVLPEMYPELKEFIEEERYPDGNRVRAVAGMTILFIPLSYRYRTRAWWSPVKDGIEWKQLDGDFDKNEGSWRFYWDEEKKQTRTILTLALALKGILSIIPESWLLRAAKNRMPDTIGAVRRKVAEVRSTNPEKVEALRREWEETVASGKPYLRVGGVPAPSAPPTVLPGGTVEAPPAPANPSGGRREGPP